MLSSLEFNEILAQAKAGRSDAIADLWRHYNPLLSRYTRVLEANHCDDITQDVWIAVARNLVRFHGGEAEFRRYLITMAHNRAVDYWRSGSRRMELAQHLNSQVASSVDSVEETAIAGIENPTLESLNLYLTPMAAEVVFLRHVAQLNSSEIADLLGRSPESIRVMLKRSLDTLRSTLSLARVRLN